VRPRPKGKPDRNKNALGYVREFIDYGYDSLEDSRKFGNNGDEWYTLSESVYKAYLLTGYEKALEFAKKWEYTEFWEMFEKDVDPFTRKPEAGLFSEFYHAYSHVNTFNSAALAYMAGGEKRYLDILLKFYAWLQDTQIYPSGGFGAEYEHFMPGVRIAAAFRNKDVHDHFETQCDSYAAYRLTKYLTEFTGEARFSDWAEQMVYNATLACLPMTKNGNIMYYSNYNTHGAYKENRADEWTCCTGSRPLLTLEIQRLIYYHGENGLYVGQFISSNLDWKRPEGVCGVRMETKFPYENAVSLKLFPAAAAKFKVYIRKPAWAEGAVPFCVDGKPAAAKAEKGWLVLEKLWEAGDEITFTLPVGLAMPKLLDKTGDTPYAFVYGPVLMAVMTECDPGEFLGKDALKDIVPAVKGAPAFRHTPTGTEIRPYFELPEKVGHFTYFDSKA
jgi:DUF1680 family protein